MQRKYDIVLLGATGFTGGLMVEYMAATFPGSLRWAIAARNKAKLEALARKFKVEAAGGSIIVLEVNPEAEIQNVVKSTRVIINVIGPYPTTCGPVVFKTCAENGTDYVDWYLFFNIQHYLQHQMIITCGLDAVPPDLTTYLAVSHIRQIFNTPTREAIVSLQEIRGGYGPNFHFSARPRLPSTLRDFVRVLPLISVGFLLSFSVTRFILTRFIYPEGYSPDPKRLEDYRFSHRTLTVADTGDESTAKRAIVDFKFQGDQYKFTGIAMVEAAVTLLEGGTEAHRLGGDVMTPAMLGDKYAENLQRPGSGVEISIRAEG
ncbi:uncharacterized protein Triagg1_841 [Trichoderma aggressivum f. europaeum]|uniref:Saccharopine dehydrogenase NADP binding domain-containing protein n=1 Tax=Trichoderma aggressivum f. europaeum TaxID=173218 RepID=A0AAE1JHK7_9HYPO|nr:hypothetical protein Triagg1_841 [Trichoderma aggressivum f. europaeum]